MLASETAQPRPVRSGLLLAVLCLAQSMLVIDVVVVIVALPAMRADLGINPADLQWVVTAYAVLYGGAMISAGRAGDLFGRRRVLLTGIVVFTVASALCGLANGAALIFVARAAQGLGAALIAPSALALVTTLFAEGEARNRALGIWGAVLSGGAAAASLIGGVLTDLVHWRAIFLINLPIGLAVGLTVLWFVRSDRPAAPGRLDIGGAGLLTAGMIMLVAAVSKADHGMTPAVAVLGGLSVLTLGAFIVTERRVANPVVRLSIFRNPYVRYGNLICVLTASATLAVQFYTTLYMQNVLGLSPLQTGLGFLPVIALIIVISSRMGPLVTRFGVRTLLIAAAVTMAAGFALLSVLDADGDYWRHVLPGLALVGLGAGLSFAPSMVVSTTGVEDREQGFATGLLNTSFQLGGALGLAVFSLVAVSAVAAPGATPAEAAVAGYSAGFRWALLIPALIVLTVVILPKQRSDAAALPR